MSSLRGPEPPKYFSLSDMYMLIFLLFFGFFSRTLRIAYPGARVFDEVHFGSFTNKYINRTYFNDVHPPLGKLLLAMVGVMSGYNGSVNFVGDVPYANREYTALRMTPASCSAMIPGMVFVAMRFFGYSRIAALMTGVLLGVESMLIVEGRLVLIDGFLHAFAALSILMVSCFRVRPGIVALICLSLAVGCTYSVKYTGASVMVFACAAVVVQFSECRIAHLFELRRRGGRHIIRDILEVRIVAVSMKCLVIGFVSACVVFITYAIHLEILCYESPEASMIGQEFRKTLKRRGGRTPVHHMSMLRRVYTVMKVMHRANMHIPANHGAASKWYEWPLGNARAVTYFSNKYALVLFPNPVIWWPAAVGPLVCLITAIIGYWVGNRGVAELIIWPIGYYASWLPFALIPRALFVYHYLVPLIFGICSVCAVIDVLLSRMSYNRAIVFTIWLAIAISTWIFFAPWCYAMEDYDWSIRTWRPRLFGKQEVVATGSTSYGKIFARALGLLLVQLICDH